RERAQHFVAEGARRRSEKAMRPRLRRDERGASLVLAIVFMVVVGAIGGSVLASLSSGVGSGTPLQPPPHPEYPAHAAIEPAIAPVRSLNAGATPITGFPSCGSDPTYTFEHDPSVDIHVDCSQPPTSASTGTGADALQNDVIFNACLASDASPSCPADK